MQLSSALMTRAFNNHGQLVSINEVNSGSACDCICVSCSAPLVAKKGDINTHHFAHENSTKCNWQPETELHLLVKEYFKEQSSIDLPIGIAQPLIHKLPFTFLGTEKCLPESNYVADFYCTLVDDTIYFEINVTHPVPPEKINFFKENRLSCVEFDFSTFTLQGDTITFCDIENHLTRPISKWLSVNLSSHIGQLFHMHNKQVITASNKQIKINAASIRQQQTTLSSLKDEQALVKRYMDDNKVVYDELLALKFNLTTKAKERIIRETQNEAIRSLTLQPSRQSPFSNSINIEQLNEIEEKILASERYLSDLLVKCDEKKRYLDELSKYSMQIKDKEDKLNSITADLKVAKSRYLSASKHLAVLIPLLRNYARDLGHPWPIDDDTITVLHEAGHSALLDGL